MRSKHFLGVVAMGLAIGGLTTGCGSSDSDTSGAGGSTSATSSSDATTATTTSADATTATTDAATTTTGSGMGDGNDSFEEAESIDIDGSIASASLDPTGDSDYYVFTGLAGQALLISLAAQDIDGVQFDPEYIDSVVTLYDSTQTKIAENDDPYPRYSNDSQLFTVLPADGTYYLRVTECNTWAAEFGASCADPDKIFTDYNLGIFNLDLDPTVLDNGVVPDVEPNDDVVNDALVDMEYVPNPNGGYYLASVIGDFSSTNDTDYYAFMMPADLPVSSGRSTATFAIIPSGVDNDGSTTSPGVVEIIDANDMSVVAQIDASLGGDLQPPLKLGTPYYFMVKHPGTTAGSNDFYVINHSGGGSNPLESDESVTPVNDTSATAELLTDTGAGDYFIEGDINVAGDVDWFKFDLPVGLDPASTLAVACGGQRSGSGIRGMTFSLHNGAGAAISGAQITEDAFTDALIQDVVVPAGQSQLMLKVLATSQDANVTSTFYRCGIHIVAP